MQNNYYSSILTYKNKYYYYYYYEYMKHKQDRLVYMIIYRQFVVVLNGGATASIGANHLQ